MRAYASSHRYSLALGALLALDIVVYSRYPHAFLGVLGFFLIIAYLGLDFVKPTGRGKPVSTKNALKELALALGAAGAAWLIACVLLNTSAPLNVVTSCSMLPNLERGDLIILQGGSYSVRETGIDADLSQAAYEKHSYGVTDGASSFVVTLQNVTVDGVDPFVYPLEACTVNYRDGTEARVPCSPSVTLAGESYSSAGNDIIIFDPVPRSYGAIIHRALLRINARDGVYYLTKGDNNQFADQRTVMQLVPEGDVKGRVLFRVPLLGYLKLFFFWQFEEPQGCDYVLA